jgi:hypothetical protein
MKRMLGLIAVAALGACDLPSDLDCEESRSSFDEMSATDINSLFVDDEDGELRIVGRAGINSVRVHATACANDRNTLDDIDFDFFRANGEINVISDVPGYDNARLDLLIEVPVDFDVSVYDTDGNVDIEDVFSVWIADGSGHIEVTEVVTDVIVDEDGSGDIDVRDIGGDFYVGYDGSGRITYRNIGGYVDIP